MLEGNAQPTYPLSQRRLGLPNSLDVNSERVSRAELVGVGLSMQAGTAAIEAAETDIHAMFRVLVVEALGALFRTRKV